MKKIIISILIIFMTLTILISCDGAADEKLFEEVIYIKFFDDNGNSLNKTITADVKGITSFKDLKFTVYCENINNFQPNGTYYFEYNETMYNMLPGHYKKGQTPNDDWHICFLFNTENDCIAGTNHINYYTEQIVVGNTYFGYLHKEDV